MAQGYDCVLCQIRSMACPGTHCQSISGRLSVHLDCCSSPGLFWAGTHGSLTSPGDGFLEDVLGLSQASQGQPVIAVPRPLLQGASLPLGVIPV